MPAKDLDIKILVSPFQDRQLTIYQIYTKRRFLILPFPRITKTKIEFIDIGHDDILTPLKTLYEPETIAVGNMNNSYTTNIFYSLNKMLNSDIELDSELEKQLNTYIAFYGFILLVAKERTHLGRLNITYIHDRHPNGLFVPMYKFTKSLSPTFNTTIITINADGKYRAGELYSGSTKKYRRILPVSIKEHLPKKTKLRLLLVEGKVENIDYIFPLI